MIMMMRRQRLAMLGGVLLLLFVGVDRLLVFSKGWPEGFAPPCALDVGAFPREGIAVNLDSGRVYVSARGDDQVAVVWDGVPACPPNFAVTEYTVKAKRAQAIHSATGTRSTQEKSQGATQGCSAANGRDIDSLRDTLETSVASLAVVSVESLQASCPGMFGEGSK